MILFIFVGEHELICLFLKISWVIEEEKFFKHIDQKLMLVEVVVIPPLTQIGTSNDLCYIAEATIEFIPNKDASYAGVDRQHSKGGLHSMHNFVFSLDIIGCNMLPLIKWRGMLNGFKDGM